MKGAFINAVLHYPGRILFLFALVVLFLCSGLSNLSISNDFRIYFSEDNPQLIAFENFEENFTPSDNASLIIEPKQGDIFTRRGLMGISIN